MVHRQQGLTHQPSPLFKAKLMFASEILCCPVAISLDPAVAPQPSVHEIVKAHFTRQFGDAGAVLAKAYLDRVAGAIDARAQASEARKDPNPGGEAEAAADTPASVAQAVEASADPSTDAAALTRRQEVAVEMLKFLCDNTGRSTFSLKEIECHLQAWKTSAEFRKRFEVLTLTDAEGGFADHHESRSHIRAVLRSLARRHIVFALGGHYGLTRYSCEAQVDSAATNEPRSAEAVEELPNAFDAVIAMLSGLGIGKDRNRREQEREDLFTEDFIPNVISTLVASRLKKA